MNTEAHSILRGLQAPDEMSLVFNPIGFGGRMEPEDAARFQHVAIANAELCSDVPETIRENFGRARNLHLYGVLEYEFFTAAGDYALLVLEGALRIRFLSYYDHRIPVSRKGQAETLHAESFDDVHREARFLRLQGSEGVDRLPLGARALLAWARQERLLPGSETRRVDRALADLRNDAAHPVGRHVGGPPDSARTLLDVAEVINTLWGRRVPGGRLFPAPVARVPRVATIALDGTGASEMRLHHVPTLSHKERESAFAVFLAAPDEELTRREGDGWTFTYQPGVQRTIYPCEQLWTGDFLQLLEALDESVFADCDDTVEHLDRLFFVRVDGDLVDEARSAADLIALDVPPRGQWYALIADNPYQAISHVRHDEGESNEEPGHCPECFVRIQGRFYNPSDAVALARKHPAVGGPHP